MTPQEKLRGFIFLLNVRIRGKLFYWCIFLEADVVEFFAFGLKAIFLRSMLMKRTALLFSLLFSLLLAACGAAEPILETETAVSPPTTDDQPAVQPADITADFAPAANVAEAAQIRDLDQTKGAEDPVVTIIEYGDFQ